MNIVSFGNASYMYWPTLGSIAKLNDKGVLAVKHKSDSEYYHRLTANINRPGKIARIKRYAHHICFMCMLNDPNWKCPKGFCIDHVNGVKEDFRWKNLELITLGENARRAAANKELYAKNNALYKADPHKFLRS